MPRPGKDRRGARLVVILEEARQPILVVEPRPQMGANGAGIAMAKAIVEALVVAVVEALLLQFPFEVPIGLGQEREAAMGVAHAAIAFGQNGAGVSPRCAGRPRAAASIAMSQRTPSHCSAIVASSAICAACSAGLA